MSRMKRKTLEELEREFDRKEKAAAKMRQRIREQKKQEQAAQDAELLDAVKQWAAANPQTRTYDTRGLIAYLHRQTRQYAPGLGTTYDAAASAGVQGNPLPVASPAERENTQRDA